MDATPGRQWRPGLLAAIEAEFFALRRRAPILALAYEDAFAHAAGAPATPGLGTIHAAGARVIAAMEDASANGELAYHNRHHVVEAVLAMGWLCGAARRMGEVSAEDAALGIVAMVGHDLLHDGSPPNGGALEARSADAVARATLGVPLDVRQRAVLRAVVRGTDPGRIARNAARAAGECPPGPLGRGVDLVVAMANEADIFASLLPNLGWHLTHDLARERERAGHGWAAAIADPGSRVTFLTTYARLTPAARGLGLGELRRCQVAAAARGMAAGGDQRETTDPRAAPVVDRYFVAGSRRVAPGSA